MRINGGTKIYMLTWKCNHCGTINNETNAHIRRVGPHIGCYCYGCDEFIKWLSKDEKIVMSKYCKFSKDDIEYDYKPEYTGEELEFIITEVN